MRQLALHRVLLLVLMCAPAGPACDDAAGVYCRVDEQCGPGRRCADGICSRELVQDTGVGDGFPPAADADAEATDAAGPPADLTVGDGAPGCTPNHDERIDRAELPVVVGAKVSYVIGSKLTVDLQGSTVNGVRRWVLSAAAADDAKVVTELLPVFDWARPHFATSTYAALLDEGLGTYGVFSAAPSALRLDGIISQQAQQTKLTYDQPVDLLRFPLTPQSVFATASNLSGTLDGLPVWLRESYAVDVMDAGTLELPQLTLQALLVRVRVEQHPVVNPLLVSRRTLFLFVSECYGIVARVLADGHPSDLTTVQARERWRLTF